MIQDERAVSLSEAFRNLEPTNPDYANLPMRDGFNWARCLEGIASVRLYLVVFRSVRRPTADSRLLKEYDDRAYAEALGAGGILHYFKGQLNERRECLSFCLWESRRKAEEAAAASSHQEAARISARMYESYDLERYEVSKVLTPRGARITFERLTAGYAAADHGRAARGNTPGQV